ncbi:tetratricopeptide repeat protein 25-like isoform X2 [Mizuhopecten yessoensis]|uniref:tetratricopeptide repeat protein 25-like isoform X2 n=1 Tax=Mizuhopecten yessoensis TaxID=6573 RepID=UPI000B45B5D6|nr:tetratricopeptide repeat protein 25-like isoform X2 [Mizuhopecten yessoensis]
MTVTLLGHRASSPKPSNHSRNLRKLQHNFNDAHIPRSGRMLPVPPCKPPEAQTGARQTRALPRVPRPTGTSVNSISVNILSSTDTVALHGRDVNPAAVPTLPRHPRQLPKVPAAGGKAQERKQYMLEMYRGEGDKFMGEAEYENAMDSYSSALKLVPDNTETFVARSRCNQLLGRNRKAMLDVDSALALDPTCLEALYQKAELQFSERNYESALVYYGKGYRQRPDLRKFQEGVDKSSEALNSGRRRNITQAGDLSMLLNNSKNRKDPIRRRNNITKLSPIANSSERDAPTPTFPQRQQNPLVRMEQGRGSNEHLNQPSPTPPKVTDDQDVTEKRIKEVLGKMYSDKKYLEKLMEQADVPRGSVDLTNMAETGLNFLYDRVLYWVRQGRIIPPEAPGTRPSTLKSTSNASTVKAKSTKIHKDGKETKEKDPMPPGSWFRYLDKKKAAEANSRKANPPQFVHVLEGQKVQLKDTLDPQRSQRPIIRRPRQENNLKVKRGRNNTLKDNLSQHHTSSDSDSGLNISFSTYKGHSEIDLKSNGSARRRSQDVTEETMTPTNTLKLPYVNTDMSKYNRGRRRIRREPIISYINKVMEDVEFAYVEGKYSECARKAESCLNTMNSYNMEEIPNVMSLTAKLYSYIGNAAIEMRDYVTGLEYHKRDLDIGERNNDSEAISRALGNLGRIYVFQSKHQKALDVFSRKIQLCTTRVESAWLYHELGNCFLVLGQYEYAREAARRSVEAAEEALDWNYQLQSSVLLGVAEVKLRQYHAAFNTFERAMDQARMQGDNKAETAIRDALNDVNDKIVEELKTRSRSQADLTRSRAEYAKSRTEWSDYSSIYIPEDDGDVSLTETGYDTENLQLELDRLRSDLDTAMFGSFAQLQENGRKSGGHVSSELKKSLQNVQMSGRNSVTNSVIRCSTAMG